MAGTLTLGFICSFADGGGKGRSLLPLTAVALVVMVTLGGERAAGGNGEGDRDDDAPGREDVKEPSGEIKSIFYIFL